MKKIPQESSSLIAANRQNLKQIFPEIFCEDQIDFQTLKQLLGEKIIDNETQENQTQEKYGLNWSGKSQARQFALSTSLATLRPKKSDSVNWQNTKNLMIEGDNLEVLKLLQKSYAAKIKMIYIDPPYNTGKDFVYPDDYAQSIQNYKKISGQTDEEGFRNQTNQESSGRFHTDWLNMIYPRLKLARNLLTPDGVIFISIDDHEVANLRKVCDEIFGEENFVNQFVVKRRVKSLNSQFEEIKTLNQAFEYIIIYRKSENFSYFNPTKKSGDQRSQGYWNSFWNNANRPSMRYEIGLINIEKGQWKWSKDRGLRAYSNYQNFLAAYDNPSEDDLIKYYLENKENFKANEGFDLEFVKTTSTTAKYWIAPSETTILDTNLMNHYINDDSGKREYCFDTVKNLELMQKLIDLASQNNDIILDFFAGSGTTAHAVMAQNALDGGNRRFILVQLPEILDEKNKDQKAAAEFCDKLNKPKNIAELTKERLRRAGEKIKNQNPLFAGDLGFRCFALDESNIKPWQIDEEDIEKSLEENCDQLLLERSDDDILCEVFLKNGLDLSCQILSKKLPTKSGELEIFADETASQIICLTKELNRQTAEELAIAIVKWHQELTLNAAQKPQNCNLVFRDSAFLDDVVKTNFLAILNQAGFTQINSL